MGYVKFFGYCMIICCLFSVPWNTAIENSKTMDPPTTPSFDGSPYFVPQVPYILRVSANDPDPDDEVYVRISWNYDTVNSSYEDIEIYGPFQSSDIVKISNELEGRDSRIIHLQAFDSAGLSSNWTEPVEIRMPEIPSEWFTWLIQYLILLLVY